MKDFYNKSEAYKSFEGYTYSKLHDFVHTLYGGKKIQNHAFNNRVNGEIKSKFRNNDIPVIIDAGGKYFINIQHLIIDGIDVSKSLCRIVESYIDLLRQKDDLLKHWLSSPDNNEGAQAKREHLNNLLSNDCEARIFEIISYVILKNHYKDITVYFGWERDKVEPKRLELYKTGRTNANDGGIDFVMRPLGRFFQVTEVGNYSKYFLDIDKVLHYPITFVVKTDKSKGSILDELNEYILEHSGGMKVLVDRYQSAIEEIITINELRGWLNDISEDQLNNIIEDIKSYYELELNL